MIDFAIKSQSHALSQNISMVDASCNEFNLNLNTAVSGWLVSHFSINEVTAYFNDTMELSETTRAQIVALEKSGMKQSAIAVQLCLSRQAVHGVLKRFKATGDFASRPRSGRPSVTSPHTDRLLIRMVKAMPSTSSRVLAASLPVPIAPRTVRHRLQTKFNMRARRPAKKPLLTAKNRRDRIAFCEFVKDWTPEMWERVLWSDETTIRQHGNKGAMFVRRLPGTRYDPNNCVATVKHSPSVMVWGSFSACGRGNLWFLPPNTTMRAANYLKVLQERLLPMMEIRQTSIFMHDGAPCHRAKSVARWLHEQSVTVLSPWPGNSPDLNPLENLWSILKTKVAQHNPTSLQHLHEVIREVWCREIDPELCKRLVHNMPQRVREVLKNKGGPTKY